MTDASAAEICDKLYVVSRLVYNGEIELEKAAAKLADIIPMSIEQIKITITMYAGMRNGRVFHHSVSDGIVIYFLQRIAEEEGKEGIELALNAVYGYAGFKYSVGSEMPELEKACDILREKYGLSKKE
ncbi:MAG TPA: hypothetical protein O0X97_04315 [Methanocorpusculum sp.]|nr:hypothetical protein [Methanocorpusculum sp.]